MNFHYKRIYEIKNRKFLNSVNISKKKNILNKSINIENFIINKQRKYLYKKIKLIKNSPGKLNFKNMIKKTVIIRKNNRNSINLKKKIKTKIKHFNTNIGSVYNAKDLKNIHNKKKKITFNISQNSRRIQSNYVKNSKFYNDVVLKKNI